MAAMVVVVVVAASLAAIAPIQEGANRSRRRSGSRRRVGRRWSVWRVCVMSGKQSVGS